MERPIHKPKSALLEDFLLGSGYDQAELEALRSSNVVVSNSSFRRPWTQVQSSPKHWDGLSRNLPKKLIFG